MVRKKALIIINRWYNICQPLYFNSVELKPEILEILKDFLINVDINFPDNSEDDLKRIEEKYTKEQIKELFEKLKQILKESLNIDEKDHENNKLKILQYFFPQDTEEEVYLNNAIEIIYSENVEIYSTINE